MGPIKTVRENCRKCYSCVRNCPVKAVRVKQHYAEVIHGRCIGCGKCIRACSQQAKVITDAIEGTRRLLTGRDPVVAVLGCSYPAFFSDVRPGQLISGIRMLGFDQVLEGAGGVELLRGEYGRLRKRAEATPLISTHCPTIVDLIERHYPQLVRNLVDAVSPMVAIGRFIKARRGPRTRVVYISSCIAGKFEIEADEVAGAVDIVLTYRELSAMLRDRGTDLYRLDDTPFAGQAADTGRLFPISGGPFRAFDISTDLLDADFVTTEGEDNVLEIITDLASGRITPKIVDLRFCAGGCIGGPGRNNRLTTFSKRNLIIGYHRRGSAPIRTASHYGPTGPLPDLRRRFRNQAHRLEMPSGDSVRKILQATNKFTEQDELNCGGCGYRTCRAHAVAVYQGLAEEDMCLPFSLRRLEEDRVSLAQKYELARRALDQEYGDAAIIGQDAGTADVLKLVQQVGPTQTTVLIRGESGTGKELTARAIHQQSHRADKPLVALNCTTLNDSLLESELFGHKKGAFTGAFADKKGLFEAASGGTIFLDEIGDITPKLQAELLRFLDSGEIRPVGENSPIKVDVRLIAATNKDLEAGVREGWFREDLFYRLNVFTVTMPPLRNRLDSLRSLVDHFIARASQRVNKPLTGIEERAVQALQRYHWPGNIRELQNIIERAAVLTRDQIIRLENLPVIFAELNLQAEQSGFGRSTSDFRGQREKHVNQVEKALLRHYLQATGGNVSAAARSAGIPRRSFYRMLERHSLKGADFTAKSP